MSTKSKTVAAFMLLGLFLLAGCAGEMGRFPFSGTKQPEPAKPEPVKLEPAQFVQAHALNFRECPSPKCRIMGVLLRGRQVTVQGQKGGWAEVTPQGDTRNGWVASRYLGPEKPAGAARLAEPVQKPVQEPPPPVEEFAPANTAPPKVKEEFVK